MREIKNIVDLVKVKIDILKLKADAYEWQCFIDDDTKNQLEATLVKVNDMLSETKDLEIAGKCYFIDVNGNKVNLFDGNQKTANGIEDVASENIIYYSFLYVLQRRFGTAKRLDIIQDWAKECLSIFNEYRGGLEK